MPRPQDTKSIAKRIDLHYFKRPGRLRWWRRLLIVVLSVGALGWMALAYSQNSEQIYNPGPVSTAHALIEHNCAACHVSDGKGGFSRAVSDNACSACHEGPVHAANQLALNSRQSPGQVVNAGNRLALAVWMATDGAPAAAAKGEAEEKGDGGASPTPADAHHGGTRLTSAQCVACHVEHRGQDALAAVADANCTQCHRNLPDAAQDRAKLQVPARVTAFTLNDHPRFGRRLKGHALATPAATATTAPAATYGAASTQAAAVDSGTETQSGERVDPSEPTPATTNGQALVSATGWVDPTRLKFNHEYHLSKVKALKDNCTACHSTAGPGSSMAPRVEGGPPFPLQDGSTSPWPWRAGDDGRYMQPVNYELHCAGCHNDKLQVPNGGPTLSHRDMSVVRAEINSLPVLYAQMLAKDANREKKLAKVKAGAGTRESRWVKEQLETLSKRLSVSGPDAAKFKELKAKVKPSVPLAGLGESLEGPNPNLVEFAVGTKCAFCHEMAGEVPALAMASYRPAAAAAASDTAKSTPDAAKGTDEPKADEPAEPPARKGPRVKRPRPGGGADAGPTNDSPNLSAFLAGLSYEGDAEATFAQARPRVRRPGSKAKEEDKPAAEAKTESGTEAQESSGTGYTVAEATAPAESVPVGPLLQTLPTGIPDVPRRWFAGGAFSHQSHRNLTCVSCHDKVLTSSMTSDVLSPDIDSKAHGGQSCIDCHQPTGTMGNRTAPSGCVTCHDYHDHSQELWPDGRPIPRSR